MKSNHGFSEITQTDEENQKRYSNCEYMRACEKVRSALYDRDIDPMFVHKRQLLGSIPIQYTRREVGSYYMKGT